MRRVPVANGRRNALLEEGGSPDSVLKPKCMDEFMGDGTAICGYGLTVYRTASRPSNVNGQARVLTKLLDAIQVHVHGAKEIQANLLLDSAYFISDALMGSSAEVILAAESDNAAQSISILHATAAAQRQHRGKGESH